MAVSTPLIHDEYSWMALVDNVSLQPGEVFLPLHGDAHPPGQIYLGALGARCFGPNLVGYRIGSVVFGVVAVALIYTLGKVLHGPGTGLLSAFLLAANEYHIGISRLCTEKNYLTLSLASVLFYVLAMKQKNYRTCWFVAAGISFGLGLLFKQSLLLWLPLFGFELLRRIPVHVWKQRDLVQILRFHGPGPWLALLCCAVVILPDVYWNFSSDLSSEDGIAFQLEKLSVGQWSWGPLSLYLRPLHYHCSELRLSEYASMTIPAGGILLIGAASSVLTLRQADMRFLQLLGWSPFLFFSLFSRPDGEFWWSDLSLGPFVLLTAAAISQLRRPMAAAIPVVLLFAGSAVVLVASPASRDNYFPHLITPAAKSVVQEFIVDQRMVIVERKKRDHLRLSCLGELTLPQCRNYRDDLEFLRTSALDHLQEEFEQPQVLMRELAWIDGQIIGFDARLGRAGRSRDSRSTRLNAAPAGERPHMSDDPASGPGFTSYGRVR
jgi:hypothetical protein